MTSSLFDDDSSEPWCSELIEPVERFLRAGMAAVQAEPDEDEADFDVDGLLRRVGFLQDESTEQHTRVVPGGLVEDDIGVLEGVDVEALSGGRPVDVRSGCPRVDDDRIAAPAPARVLVSELSAAVPTESAGGGRWVLGSVAVVVPAVATVVGVAFAVAGVVFGSVAAATAAVAATGAVAGSLLTLALQRHRLEHRAGPARGGVSGPGPGLLIAPRVSPAVIPGTDSCGSPDTAAGLVASGSFSVGVLTDPADDHADLLYEELKDLLEFDPAGGDVADEVQPSHPVFTPIVPSLPPDADVCLAENRARVFSPVPNLVAEEVEEFLSSAAADSMWLEQVVTESRRALQVRAQWPVSVPKPDLIAAGRGCSVQHLILMQIKSLVETSFRCSSRLEARHHVVIFFDANAGQDAVRASVPLFSGRKPCAERLMLWADGAQWAVARQSRSGTMSVVTHRSAARRGSGVLEELMQTYSELAVSPDAAVLC